jgi:hypothetical protein
VEKLNAKIDQWNAKIDQLRSKVDRLEAHTQKEDEIQLADRKTRCEELQQKLAELCQAGDRAWEDLKACTELAWTAMNGSLKARGLPFQQARCCVTLRFTIWILILSGS